MNLADRLCYPVIDSYGHTIGLTIRERLIIALAGNSEMVLDDDKQRMTYEWAAQSIVSQADSIIKEMEK